MIHYIDIGFLILFGFCYFMKGAISYQEPHIFIMCLVNLYAV
jgi:hypothetical protein